jgi:hypothetical protein
MIRNVASLRHHRSCAEPDTGAGGVVCVVAGNPARAGKVASGQPGNSFGECAVLCAVGNQSRRDHHRFVQFVLSNQVGWSSVSGLFGFAVFLEQVFNVALLREADRGSGWRIWRDAFLLQGANPALFFTAILLSFIDPTRPVALQVVILGVSSIVVGSLFCSLRQLAGRTLSAVKNPFLKNLNVRPALLTGPVLTRKLKRLTYCVAGIIFTSIV